MTKERYIAKQRGRLAKQVVEVVPPKIPGEQPTERIVGVPLTQEEYDAAYTAVLDKDLGWQSIPNNTKDTTDADRIEAGQETSDRSHE